MPNRIRGEGSLPVRSFMLLSKEKPRDGGATGLSMPIIRGAIYRHLSLRIPACRTRSYGSLGHGPEHNAF